MITRCWWKRVHSPPAPCVLFMHWTLYRSMASIHNPAYMYIFQHLKLVHPLSSIMSPSDVKSSMICPVSIFHPFLVDICACFIAFSMNELLFQGRAQLLEEARASRRDPSPELSHFQSNGAKSWRTQNRSKLRLEDLACGNAPGRTPYSEILSV